MIMNDGLIKFTKLGYSNEVAQSWINQYGYEEALRIAYCGGIAESHPFYDWGSAERMVDKLNENPIVWVDSISLNASYYYYSITGWE